jgi:nucleoside-diphosphate-sugar epimerase
MAKVVVTGEGLTGNDLGAIFYRYLFTGASGVLGSAIYRAFRESDCLLTGLANSRAQGGLDKLDLTHQAATQNFFRELKPDCRFSFSWVPLFTP